MQRIFLYFKFNKKYSYNKKISYFHFSLLEFKGVSLLNVNLNKVQLD